jgi:hypothetical protein
MPTIRRVVKRDDGSEQIFLPHRDRKGQFVLHTKLTDAPLGHSTNQVRVADEAELVEKLRTKQYHLRMSVGKGSPVNLISPDSIEIIED